jgi:hypothetical protein
MLALTATQGTALGAAVKPAARCQMRRLNYKSAGEIADPE